MFNQILKSLIIITFSLGSLMAVDDVAAEHPLKATKANLLVAELKENDWFSKSRKEKLLKEGEIHNVLTQVSYRIDQFIDLIENAKDLEQCAYIQLSYVSHIINSKEEELCKRYKEVPWALLRYSGSIPIETVSRRSLSFFSKSLDEFKSLKKHIDFLRRQESNRESVSFPRIEYFGKFFRFWKNFNKLIDFCEVDDIPEMPGQRKRKRGEEDKQKDRVIEFKQLRVFQGAGECMSELIAHASEKDENIFLDFLGIPYSYAKSLKEVRNSLFHPGESTFALLSEFKVSLSQLEPTIIKDLEKVRIRCKTNFSEFEKKYFESFATKDKIVSDLDEEKLESKKPMEELAEQLKKHTKKKANEICEICKKKKKKENKKKKDNICHYLLLKTSLEDFKEGLTAVKSITKGYVSEEPQNIGFEPKYTLPRLMENPIFEELFEGNNIFVYALDFLLSSFRESSNGIKKAKDILQQTKGLPQGEFERLFKVLEQKHDQANEIAHNEDVLLSSDFMKIVDKKGNPRMSRYDFVHQDLITGYEIPLDVIGFDPVTNKPKITKTVDFKESLLDFLGKIIVDNHTVEYKI